MRIKALDDFAWSFHGAIKSFHKGKEYTIEGSNHAREMINAGLAEEIEEKQLEPAEKEDKMLRATNKKTKSLRGKDGKRK
jgi:hypothetical protein